MADQPGRDSPEALLAGLRAELQAFREFRELLETEHAVLRARDIDALVGIAQRKSALVGRLAQLAQTRNAYLKAATGLSDQPGMEAWITRFDPLGRTEGSRLWQGLLEVARAAKRLNEENGALINLNLQHNQQALAILRGAAIESTALYGPDGQSYTASSGRPLGKA